MVYNFCAYEACLIVGVNACVCGLNVWWTNESRIDWVVDGASKLQMKPN